MFLLIPSGVDLTHPRLVLGFLSSMVYSLEERLYLVWLSLKRSSK